MAHKKDITDISGKHDKRDPRKGLPAVKKTVGVIDSVYGKIPGQVVLPDQKWEDLDGAYDAAAQAIYTVGSELAALIALPGIKQHIKNPGAFNTALGAINSDLLAFTDELVAIKARHKGKTGQIVESNDLALCLSIFEDYANFTTRFVGVTTPAVLELGGAIDEAKNAMTAEAAATEPVAPTTEEVAPVTTETEVAQ